MGGAALQVADDCFCNDRATQSCSVNLKVFDNTLNVIPGFPVGNRFDPVDHIDAGFAWITELTNPPFRC